jgi:hypothetical protein
MTLRIFTIVIAVIIVWTLPSVFASERESINFAHPDFRKVVLNGVVWTAGIEIPQQGIETPSPSLEELQKHISSTVLVFCKSLK